MFNIKVKVKGYLKNLTEKEEEIINTIAIKNSNIISYIIDNIKYKLILEKEKISLQRENNEFSHIMIFVKNKTIPSEYYLKESNYSLEFNILTTELILTNNKLEITYKIEESENTYNYVLEMSDNL